MVMGVGHQNMGQMGIGHLNMGQTGIGHQNMGQIFFGTKSARTKYEFDQICLGPTNYLRNWRWPIFLDQLLLGPNADNQCSGLARL